MKTMKITRHTVAFCAPNHAKYGANPPREGYINSWTEEIEVSSPEDEDYYLDQQDLEKAQAERELHDWVEWGK